MNLCSKATCRVAFFICFFMFYSLFGEGSNHLTFKALWVVRTSMTSQKDINAALEFAKKNGFNHLFIQIRGRGDAFYNSSLVPKTNLIVRKNFDPLDYVIRKGHASGLKIHAWMNTYLVWSARQLPSNDNHILNRNPEWVDHSFFKMMKLYSENVSLRNQIGNQHYLSPAHPGVKDHLLQVFEEILLKYDIDGLHLDYIRYNDADFGYNRTARNRFKQEYGIDPIQLYTSSKGESSAPNIEDSRQDLWQKWNQYRRDSVTDLVRQCNSLILDVKSDCILSAAVKPNLNSAKERFLQEWDRWLVEGLVDYVVPMNYSQNLREFARNIDILYESIPQKYWPGIVMGIAVYNQDALDARDKIRYSRITGFSGISIFSYDSQKDDPDFFIPIVEELSQ